MKVFISQPMRGRSDEEILKEREEITNLVKDQFPGEEIEILESFFEDGNGGGLYFLGRSLMLLDQADLVVFAPDALSARGCSIEYTCCQEYGKKILKAKCNMDLIDPNELVTETIAFETKTKCLE